MRSLKLLKLEGILSFPHFVMRKLVHKRGSLFIMKMMVGWLILWFLPLMIVRHSHTMASLVASKLHGRQRRPK
jgi:hypothetical protein